MTSLVLAGVLAIAYAVLTVCAVVALFMDPWVALALCAAAYAAGVASCAVSRRSIRRAGG